MDTSPISAATSAAASQPAKKPDGNPALSSDFETFLKMLTVQMENQDPMNPMEFERVRRAARHLLGRRAAGPDQ